MKIIDSNKDFYDFYQNIYRDKTLTFDRRDSYNLSRTEFASHFYFDENNHSRWFRYRDYAKIQYVILQVCNTFWLFELTILKTDAYACCQEYSLKLLDTWKDYNAQMQLIYLAHVRFPYYVKDTLEKKVEAIHSKNYDVLHVFNKFTISRSNGVGWDTETRHIPILQNIGIASEVNPLDIYLALEEYFNTQITNNERVESIGLTNDEKITNHGFNLKDSFRGK